jgi:hypothetical protein
MCFRFLLNGIQKNKNLTINWKKNYSFQTSFLLLVKIF